MYIDYNFRESQNFMKEQRRDAIISSIKKSLKKGNHEMGSILNGQNIYLVTMHNGQQIATEYSRFIQIMGGVIQKRINENLTVAVVNQLNKNALKKLKKLNIPIVSILWILGCITQKKRVPYEGYLWNSVQAEMESEMQLKIKEQLEKSLDYFMGSYAQNIANVTKQHQKLVYFIKASEVNENSIPPTKIQLYSNEREDYQSKPRNNRLFLSQSLEIKRKKTLKFTEEIEKKPQNIKENLQNDDQPSIYKKYLKSCNTEILSKKRKIPHTELQQIKQGQFIPICINGAYCKQIQMINYKRKKNGMLELKIITKICSKHIFLVNQKYKVQLLNALIHDASLILRITVLKLLESQLPHKIESENVKQYQLFYKIRNYIEGKRIKIVKILKYEQILQTTIEKLGGIIVDQAKEIFENMVPDIVISNRKTFENIEISEMNFIESLVQKE